MQITNRRYCGLEPRVRHFYFVIPSSTLVGNTQIKLTLRKCNLRCYNRRLNL